MGENKLRVVFDPKFIEDLSELGNSLVLSDYSVEDLREEITNVSQVLNSENPYYYATKIPVVGFWDPERKEFKTHIPLPHGVYSSKVTEDGSMLEMDVKSGNINTGDGLVRVIRFRYTKNLGPSEESETAFIVTGDITRKANGKLVIDPIECDQDKIIITVADFPDTTKANIRAATIEKDTEFLESYGILRGCNVFRTYNLETPGTRESAIEYIDWITSKTKIEKKDVPYIEQDGRGIFRRDNIRVYTGINIYCSNLMTSIRPKTRASLNRNGGTLKIYGTLWYTEYEALGKELVYVGEGTEAIDGIPDSKLILTTHNDGLRDVGINGFYVTYGRYEGQSDPSVLVKARIEFWNPLSESVETLESENIRLTQADDVISQWEVIYRSSRYLEPTGGTNLPVYVFPWSEGGVHTFTIRTTLPDINIERDFFMEYEDPVLQDLFDYRIERIPDRTYPITDYRVTLTTKTSNLDTLKWLPIINDESTLKLSTLWLRDYDFYESFYFVQSPKTEDIELHDPNNQNLQEIVLEYNQTQGKYYPVGPEARTPEELGERDTWEVIDHDPRISFSETSGKLNPSNPEYLDHRLILYAPESPGSINDLELGKIILGRIRESEVGNNFLDPSEWRNTISLSRVSIPVRKRGNIESISSDNSVILREINLYKIKVTCNGPFACWMSESPDYCFFDPITNQPTYTNYYYSENFDISEGVYVWIALHDTIILNEEPELVGKIFFTVTGDEPDWGDGSEMPDIFSSDNIAICDIYRQAPQEIILDYTDPRDCYVFLGSYEETALKFRSTETPAIDRLTMLDNNGLGQQFEMYRPYSYNAITLLDAPTPQFTTTELYRYHVQHIQNPNDLHDYYPISPCCIYRAHPYNHSDITKGFYIFRKALGPSFYRADGSGSNVIYVTPDPENNSNESRKAVVIKSRYEIRDEEFTTELNVPAGFEIETITHTTLSTSDYKHQYRIVLNTLETNTGGQRLLGILVITSRIYNLINFTSYESPEVPYVDLTQADIDAIVPPAIMKIQIIQEAGNGGNTGEIRVTGNREASVSNGGETRSYTINSDIPIELPVVTNILDCDVTGISVSGFTFRAESIIEDYSPVVPSETSSYTTYANEKELGFDLLINPTDHLTYQSYSESFTFKQTGISNGLVFGTSRIAPKLYLGSNNITEEVSSETTSLNIFLGIFGIRNQISEGTQGIVKGIDVRTDNTYTLLSDTCSYYNTSWVPSVRLEFPENNTQVPINRVFTITYTDSGITHKIVLTVRQTSRNGNIVCSDNAYFLSHGECIETDDYSDNLGFFTFDTDLNINTLSLSIPKSLGEEYNFIYVGPSSLGGSYKTYKAYIKLKPNLSNSTIGNQIFNFIKNGTDIIKSVYINQGFYCLTVCEPKSTLFGVCSGGSLGSENNPYQVPTKNNTIVGTRQVFKLILYRSEPIPSEGRYTGETIDLTSVYFPEVVNYSWIFTSIKSSGPTPSQSNSDDRGAQNQESDDSSTDKETNNKLDGGYFTSYSTSLFQSASGIEPQFCPFLENIYTVSPSYYTSEIGIRVSVDIVVKYPYTDPLYLLNKTTTHSYTIYLSKQGEIT